MIHVNNNMPIVCAVIGCSIKGASYRIPSVIKNQGTAAQELSERRRWEWIRQIGRSNITFESATYQRVCGRHFLFGHAAAPWDKNHPDWIPTLNMGHDGSTKRGKKVPIRDEQTKSKEERLSPLPPSEMNFRVEIDTAEDIQPHRTADHLLCTRKRKSAGARKHNRTGAQKRNCTDVVNDTFSAIPDHINTLLPSVHHDRTDFLTVNFPPRSRCLLQPSEIKTEIADITEDLPVSFAAEPHLYKDSLPTSGLPSTTASENRNRESSLQSDRTNFVPVSFPTESHCLPQPSEIKTEVEIKTEIDDMSEDHPVLFTVERHQESKDSLATSAADDSLAALCGVKYQLMNGITTEAFASFDNDLQGNSDFDNPSSAYRSDGPHETSSGEDEVDGHEEEVLMDFKTALKYILALKLFAFRHMPLLTDTFLAAEKEIKAEFVKRQSEGKQVSVSKLS